MASRGYVLVYATVFSGRDVTEAITHFPAHVGNASDRTGPPGGTVIEFADWPSSTGSTPTTILTP